MKSSVTFQLPRKMDATKQLCRLCAENKPSAEMMGEINDPLLGIKQKLITCCQWNNLEQFANEYFPENVCIGCIQKLETCWEFSESVGMAQRTLLNIINSIKPLDYDDTNNSNSNIVIEKVHIKFEINDGDLDEPLTFDSLDEMDGMNNVDVNVDTHKKISLETSTKDDEVISKRLKYEKSSDDGCKEICSNKLAMKAEPSTSQIVQKSLVQRIRKRRDPCTRPYLKRPVDDFLNNIRNEDRLDDGTVDPQRILMLELKNWLVMQYQCYLCNSDLGDNHQLKMHFLQEHPQNQLKYVCCFCSKLNIKHSVKLRHTIHEHIRNFHLTHLKYCCWRCNRFFWDLNKMGQHVTEHKSSPKNALCDTCGKIFKHESALRWHVKSHLPAELKPIFECYLCRKNYGSKLGLHFHMRNHIDSPKFKCEKCGQEFIQKSSLTQHNNHIHSDYFPHSCSYCGKKFKQKMNLVNHVRIHSNERPYHCDYCLYTCSNSGNMLKHIRQKHHLIDSDMKQHYTFEYESALRLHVKSHSPAKLKPMPFECYLCRKHFASKLALHLHIRIHIDSQKFKCETCNREFYRKDELKRHSYIHSINRHPCSICGRNFREKTNLVNHVRTHTKERPYLCNHCPYTCTESGNMLKHIRKKHHLSDSDMKQHYTKKKKSP